MRNELQCTSREAQNDQLQVWAGGCGVFRSWVVIHEVLKLSCGCVDADGCFLREYLLPSWCAVEWSGLCVLDLTLKWRSRNHQSAEKLFQAFFLFRENRQKAKVT